MKNERGEILQKNKESRYHKLALNAGPRLDCPASVADCGANGTDPFAVGNTLARSVPCLDELNLTSIALYANASSSEEHFHQCRLYKDTNYATERGSNHD